MKKLAVSLIVVLALVLVGGGWCGVTAAHKTYDGPCYDVQENMGPFYEIWEKYSNHDQRYMRITEQNVSFLTRIAFDKTMGEVSAIIIYSLIDNLAAMIYELDRGVWRVTWMRCGHEAFLDLGPPDPIDDSI